MSLSCVDRAQGIVGKKVSIKADDQIIRNDGNDCVIQRISPNGATNRIRLHLISPDAGYERKPAYYALVPLTIVPDVVTLPFQVFYFMYQLSRHYPVPC
jgi:hypothetical protein